MNNKRKPVWGQYKRSIINKRDSGEKFIIYIRKEVATLRKEPTKFW